MALFDDHCCFSWELDFFSRPSACWTGETPLLAFLAVSFHPVHLLEPSCASRPGAGELLAFQMAPGLHRPPRQCGSTVHVITVDHVLLFFAGTISLPLSVLQTLCCFVQESSGIGLW